MFTTLAWLRLMMDLKFGRPCSWSGAGAGLAVDKAPAADKAPADGEAPEWAGPERAAPSITAAVMATSARGTW
jgi:hypothetical protein